MNELILNEDDLITGSHWPVITVFGFYGGEGTKAMNFVNIIENLGKGVGYGYNDAGCTFWDELDEFDKAQEKEPFDVYCYVLDESCTLSYAELFHYMRIAGDRYVKRFPDSLSRIHTALDEYSRRFLK